MVEDTRPHSRNLLQSIEIGKKAPASPSRPHTPASHITLQSLTLSSELTEKMVSNIRSISRLHLVIILLHHSKGLTYDSLMTLSRELGSQANDLQLVEYPLPTKRT